MNKKKLLGYCDATTAAAAAAKKNDQTILYNMSAAIAGEIKKKLSVFRSHFLSYIEL